MILITKGGLSRGGDNEMPENCLYDCRLRDTCKYVPRWADEETLLRIGTERSKSCPLVQVYEVPKETEQAHTVMFDRKTENSSEKPNNCEYAENPSGEVWECGCFLDTYCEHQIYDRNPDGTINIVECGYEPKDEPTISKMEQVDKDINVRSKDEPQTDCAWK